MSTPRLGGRRLAIAAGVLFLLPALVFFYLDLPFLGAASLSGTDLRGVPAPDFQLVDHTGERVSLSDLRGKAVALTFLYTSCPDVCPLIAGKLGQVHDQLGRQAGDAAFVAVTVDPERDDVPRLRQYLDAQELGGKMTFLTGERQELERVWAAYHIAVTRTPAGATGQNDTAAHEVGHTTVVYVIDKWGRERRLLREDFDPAALSRNLEILIRE